MNIQDVTRLFAYNRWANTRFLAVAARLAPEAFTQELGASFGSVRGTLFHIFGGERLWLQRWKDGSRPADPDVGQFPDVLSLSAAWSVLDRERDAFGSTLTEARLGDPVPTRTGEYPLGDLILHATNHSTYHRGQLAMLLRQLGQEPPPTDYGLFVSEVRNSAV